MRSNAYRQGNLFGGRDETYGEMEADLGFHFPFFHLRLKNRLGFQRFLYLSVLYYRGKEGLGMSVDELLMGEALAEARRGLELGELPVGAVIARGERIIARAHNERECSHDPTAHAEILALRRAAEAVGGWRLAGLALYATLEPCPMCAGAIVEARLLRVVFGAYDERSGCCGSLYRITEDPGFRHFCPATGGVRKDECAALLNAFFRENRRMGL